jgi:hypothetical protein
MMFWQLHFAYRKEIIRRTIQVQAQSGELPKVELHRIAPKHLTCGGTVDAYFYQISRGVYNAPD